jgi:hypothetical protein
MVRERRGYSSLDVHRALFPTPPKPRTLAQLKEGVRRDIQRRRAVSKLRGVEKL